MKMKKRWVIALVLGFVLFSGSVFVAGVFTGDWVSDNNVKARVVGSIDDMVSGRAAEERRGRVFWGPLLPAPHLHGLEVATVELTGFETYGEGGAIEDIGGHILFASPTGQIGYLSRGHELNLTDVRVPMNQEGLQAHEIYQNPRFVRSYFRTLDLLAAPRDPGLADLYVSHHRFGDGCFELVVSHTTVSFDENGLEVSDDWDDVFVAKPCMAPKSVDLFWGGLESGGRMVLLGDGTLLLTIGDHQFDGVRTETALAQDPDADLGKVVAIDPATGESRIYASGLRNPQGLLATSDGTVWLTDHGPKGGDELTVVVDGANYGWPLVTYGTDYGGPPRRDWPLNPTQGRHDGYDRPAFVFVPSIAIMNLIEPDERTFPLWKDHLIVSSLGGYDTGDPGTLYLVRIEEGNDPVYASPMHIEDERLRDIISLDDGRFAVLTDRGDLLLFRNQEPPDQAGSPREESFVVTHAASVQQSALAAQALQPAARGERIFVSECAHCHSLGGGTGEGPSLTNVFGRRVGSRDDFEYSPALANRDEEWTRDRLMRFLTDLEPEYAGSSMPAATLSYDDAVAVLNYLEGR